MNRRVVAVVVGLAAAALATPASAAPLAHITQFDAWVTPTSGCPGYLGADLAHIVGTGHGLAGYSVTRRGDFRATNTFVGTATATFYDPANVDAVYGSDEIQSATPTGPPDAVATGRLKQTFHVSENNRTMALAITYAFHGTDQDGTEIDLHGNQHGTWLPGTDPEADPPSISSSHATC